jgi:hypothetical protein
MTIFLRNAVLGATILRAMLLKDFCLSLLLSLRSGLATSCMGPAVLGTTLRKGGTILEVAMDEDDNNFSKECCIGGNIIESNATEGLTSFPPVESKAMACHAMRGTHSSGNNIREGGAILEVAMDDDGNNFSKECCIGGNIIKSEVTEGLPSLFDGGTGWCQTHCWCHVAGLTAGAKDGIVLGLIIGLGVRLATGLAI